LDDPVNGVDPLGLEARKGAGRRIATSSAVGVGLGAWRGSTFGWPGTIAGAIMGGTSGLLRGTINEYPPLRKIIDETKEKTIHELTDGSAERMKRTRWRGFDPKEYTQTDK